MSKTHKRECIYRHDDKEIFSSLDHEKEALWKDAYRRRIILLGKEDSEAVDWATFDLVVATSHFSDKDKSSYLNMLKKFWMMFWPYLRNLIAGYQELQAAWDALVDDQDEVLKGYADQNLELKAYRDFVKNCNPHTKHAFEVFFAKRKKEDEEKMEEVRKKYAEMAKKDEHSNRA